MHLPAYVYLPGSVAYYRIHLLYLVKDSSAYYLNGGCEK